MKRYVFLLLGLAMTLFGIINILGSNEKINNKVEVQAIVSHDGGIPKNAKSKKKHLYVDYEYNGNQYSGMHIYTSEINIEEGEEITIKILPDRPQECYLKSDAENEMSVSVLEIIFGVVFLSIGIISFFQKDEKVSVE